MRDLSAKIIPILRRTSAELQEKAATDLSKAEEAATELSSVKATILAEGSGGGGENSTEASTGREEVGSIFGGCFRIIVYLVGANGSYS